jgi:DNA adenine methylase
MAELMRSLQGRAVLSINDHPEIRRVFEGFAVIPLQIRYTVGREGRDQAAGELIIKSWDDRQAQLL